MTDKKAFIPWFLNCNRERYPYWFGKRDPRNEIYFKEIIKFGKTINFNRIRMCPHLFGGALVTCFHETTSDSVFKIDLVDIVV